MSTVLTGPVTVVGQNLHSSSATRAHNLGETVFSSDGRAYRYCLAGGADLVAGNLQQTEIEVTGDQNLTAVAASVGDFSIVSTSSVTVDANEYAEGFAMITVTPGLGLQYKISSHIAYSAAAPTFTIEDSIQVALTTTSRFDLCHSLYSDVIQNPSSATSSPIGVAVFAITTLEYGWIQVSGIATVLSDGATAVGNFVSASGGTNGAVIDATHATEPIVGNAHMGIASGEHGAIKLMLF